MKKGGRGREIIAGMRRKERRGRGESKAGGEQESSNRKLTHYTGKFIIKP